MTENLDFTRLSGSSVFVAGHNGMVGRALVRRLEQEPCSILTADRAELDLGDQSAVLNHFRRKRPDIVILAAAKVGGIEANRSQPVDFLVENLKVQLSVIAAAHEAGVARLLFLGSSCIYPRLAPQPIKEEHLLAGPLESTNEGYAIAKIAGVKMCQAYSRQYARDYFSVMPTNLYGVGDNYHPEYSHVPAALIRRFNEAKRQNSPKVSVWGTGSPRREFLFVDDLADACVFLLKRRTSFDVVNVGIGEDLTIRNFALLTAEIVGFRGEIEFDEGKPDGTPRKLLDVSRMTSLGWRAKTALKDGLEIANADFLRKNGLNSDVA